VKTGSNLAESSKESYFKEGCFANDDAYIDYFITYQSHLVPTHKSAIHVQILVDFLSVTKENSWVSLNTAVTITHKHTSF
jgi:hypothetical protein